MRPIGRIVLSGPLFLVLVLGCSRSSTPAKVSGKVTYKGEVVSGGLITFHNENGGIYSYNLKFEDGTYSGADLPLGEMVVTIDTEALNPEGRQKREYKGGKDKMGADPNEYKAKMQKMGKVPEGPVAVGKYVKLPAKYNDPKKSPLKVTLVKGQNKNDFDLAD
jgi:hypothetical protein